MGGLPIPNVYILVGLDASIQLPSPLQGVFTKRVSRSRFDAFMGFLDALYEACPQEGNDHYWVMET